MGDVKLRVETGDIERNGSKRLARLVAVLLAFALIAAACGGGSTESDSGAADTGAGDDGGSEAEAEGDADEESRVDESADGSDVASASELEEIETGGTIRIGLQTEADTLNPTNTPLNRAPTLIATAIFDTIVVIDADGQWQNNLSESWTPSDDFTSWEMTLRDGIQFSDGETLNADAVIRTAEAFFADPLTSLVFKPAFATEVPFEKVDDLTVRFNASGPNTQLPSFFAEQVGMIGSPAWLDARDADPSLDQLPVGAGPYRIDERIQDQICLLYTSPSPRDQRGSRMPSSA